jgi:uncharacterized protein
VAQPKRLSSHWPSAYNDGVLEPSLLAGSPLYYVLLVAIGLLVGTYGTMAGIGGGVVLLPVLLFIFPSAPPADLTAISMAVVFLNALSGALAYARQQRIDYRNGLIFAAATVPASLLGVWAVQYLPVRIFALIFGLLLVAIAGLVFLRPRMERAPSRRGVESTIIDRSGHHFVYRVNRVLGAGLSLFIGFLAGLLGIGGGVIHVPVLVYVLDFPVHIATATSHFILVFTALTGTIMHLILGHYAVSWPVVLATAVGVIPGAQLGAFFARRVHGLLIVRLLALALLILGLRLLLQAVF